MASDVRHVRLELRAVLEARPLAIDLVSTLVTHVALADRAFRHELITAFGEVFNNVVIHGYRGRSDGRLVVDAEIGADYMIVRVSDHGLAVDFASVSPPELESFPESGMGIFMIHAMVDEVTYAAGSPNVLSLTKRIQPGSRL